MSFQKLKDQYEALTPKKKKLVTFGGPLLILVVLWLLLGADEELIKIPERNESEMGLFGVNDEEVTIGDLSTKLSAVVQQVDMLAQRDNTTAASVKRMEDIINSMDGSNTNLQTMYDLQRKLSELEEKLADVQVSAQAPRTERATITYVEDPSSGARNDPAPGETTTVDVVDRDDIEPAKTSRFDDSQEAFDYSNQRTELPEDPIAFLNQATEKVGEIKTVSRNNMFVRGDNEVPSAGVKSTTSVTDEVAKANDKVNSGPEYEGKRVLAGSVIPFVLINGFEAPAGEAASEFPTSATVRLTGPAIGPNGYSVDLTGCLITNLVRGDAATERAKLRPDRLTCKYSYGEVDVAVQGFASGHDGSAGIRGRLVNNKRDKILTYGTLTGGLAGLGQAFGGNGASRQVSLGGAYELPETRDVAIGASTSAVSNAADFLTEYYRNKLQEYYDVIEVKPLVTGTIHIMTTFKMKLIDEERAKGRTNDNV
jgi:hypothetical protein